MSNQITLQEKLDSVLNQGIADRHSFFKLQNFVLGTEYTIQGKLWQTIRELKSRKESLDLLTQELENASENMALFEIKIEKEECKKQKIRKKSYDLDDCIEKRLFECNIKEIELEIKKYTRKHKNSADAIFQIKEKIRYIEEEVNFLLHAFDELSKVETIKPIDDVEAQKEYWNAKLTQEINLNLLLGKSLPTDLVKIALSLHDGAPVKIQMIKMLKKTMEEIEEKEKVKQIEGKNG